MKGMTMLFKHFNKLVGLCALLFASISYGAEGDKPVFYKLELEGKTAFLLGSIHVGRDDFYPLPELIESRFNQAEALVIEADVTQGDIMALIRQYGIKNVEMDSETKQLMGAYCQPRAALCQAIQSYAPWMQATQIEMVRFAEMGYNAEKGIEMYLMATRGDKPVLELESVEFQFQLLASFSTELQWKMLKDAISSTPDEQQALVDAWRYGDDAGLLKLLEEKMGPEDEEFVHKLLWQRNKGMAERIVSLMADPLTPKMFIAVGGLHLVGEKSLPEYLSQNGVKLTQCWKSQC